MDSSNGVEQDGQSPEDSRAQGPPSSGQKFKKSNFPVSVKIRIYVDVKH